MEATPITISVDVIVEVTHAATDDKVTNKVNTNDTEPHVLNQTGGLRQSSRISHSLIWIQDYVTQVSKTHPHSQSNYVSYGNVSPKYRVYLSKFSTDVELNTYEEAIRKKWVHARQQEIQALEENGTWEIVHLPKGKKAIGYKWVFKIKYKADGQIDRFKARLVEKGYSHTEGIDYQEIFSLVGKMVIVRSIIALVVAENWKIYQMDIFNAFLLEDIFEEVYMELSKGFYIKRKDRQIFISSLLTL